MAEFDIHRVNTACELEHKGRVYLDNASTDVGIPVDETIYLNFIFASKGFLSSTISAVQYGTLLTPRPGYGYEAQVNYNKGIYGVVIQETRRGSASRRILEQRPLSNCKASSSDTTQRKS